jgi:hypothetical protein
MSWSLNELEAETRKAIRGAGFSWGLSEEGSKAARWLAAHGVDPLPALSDILERHDRRANITSTVTLTEAGRWQAEAPICPITLGVALCDYADRLAADACVAGPVARPLLLVPFVATAARILKSPVRLDVDGTSIVLSGQGDPSCDLATLAASDASGIRCEMIGGHVPVPQARTASTHGIATDPQSWARISSYVQRTYVPASERSRREGAGAGLIDND